jgi:hypothetical protein
MDAFYWERTTPIVNTNPELEDVDDLKRYMNAWYFGAMADALSLKGVDAPEYVEEKEKFTVVKPEFDNSTPRSAAYEAVFGTLEE